MAVTAGTVVHKISELRSKTAVIEALILHLTSNYVTREDEKSDTPTPPEMILAREDFSSVPEAHILLVVQDLRESAEHMLEELRQWEEMPITVPEPKRKEARSARDRSEGKTAPKDHDG